MTLTSFEGVRPWTHTHANWKVPFAPMRMTFHQFDPHVAISDEGAHVRWAYIVFNLKRPLIVAVAFMIGGVHFAFLVSITETPEEQVSRRSTLLTRNPGALLSLDHRTVL